METAILLTGAGFNFLVACNQPQEQKNTNSFSPRIAEDHGYLVLKDRMSEPKIVLAGKPGLPANGLRYKEIGDQRCISIKTVRKHNNNINQKLHVQSGIDAANKIFAGSG